jgi:hypothetical protein
MDPMENYGPIFFSCHEYAYNIYSSFLGIEINFNKIKNINPIQARWGWKTPPLDLDAHLDPLGVKIER